MSTCPICHQNVAARAANPAFPFCSARCKTIDLGKWLSEEYRVPTPPDEAGEGGEDVLESEPSEQEARGEPGMRH